MCIINRDGCVWCSKLSELSLFSLKFIDTCISAFHIWINISDMILRVWISGRMYSKLSVITSLPEIYWQVCNCISYIHTYQCFSIYWMFEWKDLLKVKLLLVLWCMTAHLKIKRNTDKCYGHKIKLTYSKHVFFLSLNYCNIFEKGRSPLKYFMFLKNSIRWFTR